MKLALNLPINLKTALDEILFSLNDKARITHVAVAVDDSIVKECNATSVDFSYYPKLTPSTFYTYGATYKKVLKAIAAIKDSKFITGSSVILRKTCKSGYKNIAKNYINTVREYMAYDYTIVFKFEGMTPEKVNYLAEKEAEKQRQAAEAKARRDAYIKHINYYKELNKDAIYEFAGCANGWGDNMPELVKIADNDKDCFYESIEIGRCQTKYVCHKYKFYYTVDSSD